MQKNKLPESRNFGWKLKPFESAKTSITKLPTGQTFVTIEHGLLKGVTCEMLVWWFNKFTTLKVEVNAIVYPAYLIWHPHDHIRVDGIAATPELMQKGDKLHIVEYFDRNHKYSIDNTSDVDKLDKNGIILSFCKFDKVIMHLHHSFTQTPEGVLYFSKLTLGIEKGLLKPFFNKIIIP